MLDHAPAWLEVLGGAGLPLSDHFLDRIGSPSARAAFGFDNQGFAGVAVEQTDKGRRVALELSFTGRTNNVDELLSAVGGQPIGRTVWEDGRLSSIDGRPQPPSMAIGLRDGLLQVYTGGLGSAGPGPEMRKHLTGAHVPDGSCTVAMNLSKLDDAPASETGFIVATAPMQATGFFTADMYVEPILPVVDSWSAPVIPRTAARPALVFALGSPELFDTVKPNWPELADTRIDGFQAVTIALFEDKSVALALTLPEDASLTRTSLESYLAHQAGASRSKIRKRGKGVFQVQDRYATVSGNHVFIAASKDLALDMRSSAGVAWLGESALAMAADYPVVAHAGASVMGVPFTVGARGAHDHNDALIQVDDIGAALAARIKARESSR